MPEDDLRLYDIKSFAPLEIPGYGREGLRTMPLIAREDGIISHYPLDCRRARPRVGRGRAQSLTVCSRSAFMPGVCRVRALFSQINALG